MSDDYSDRDDDGEYIRHIILGVDAAAEDDCTVVNVYDPYGPMPEFSHYELEGSVGITLKACVEDWEYAWKELEKAIRELPLWDRLLIKLTVWLDKLR